MDPSALVQNTASRLLRQMLAVYSEGELPPESGLADEMGVSRTTVRAALKILEDEGVLVLSGSKRKVAEISVLRSKNLQLVEERIPREREIEEYLMRKIASGKFKSGQRISELSIAREVGCSTTPVREALRALQQIGLFEKNPRKQWSVAELRLDLVEDLIETRNLVESYGLRKMLECGLTNQMRAELEEIYALTSRISCSEPFSRGDCLRVDMRLHRALLEATSNSILIRNHQFVYALIELQLHNNKFSAKRMGLGLAEHQNILKAILVEDLKLAEKELADHLETAGETLRLLAGA